MRSSRGLEMDGEDLGAERFSVKISDYILAHLLRLVAVISSEYW